MPLCVFRWACLWTQGLEIFTGVLGASKNQFGSSRDAYTATVASIVHWPPLLTEHGRALKDHGRAWIDLKMTNSDQVASRQSGLDRVHHFSVILDAKMGARVFDHTQRGA